MQNRLNKELSDLTKNNPLPGISVSADPNCRLKWHAIIEGPKGSPYQEGKFKLDITFPENYPFRDAWIEFTMKIFHPCVTEKGEMKLQRFYEGGWQPTYTVGKVLLGIQKMFTEFKIDNLNSQAEELYKNNRAKFDFIASEETQKYAL